MQKLLYTQIQAWQDQALDAWLAQTQSLWADAGRARRYLARCFAERLELALPEICQQRQRAFGFKVQAQDYAERLLELPGSGHLLAGIRFRNLDPDFPFIELASDLAWSAFFARLPEIKARLKESFKAFEPLGLTLRLPASLTPPSEALSWNLWLVGRPQAPDDPAGLELNRPAQPMDYARYLAQYRLWGSFNPELAQWVSPESESSLLQAFEAGLYYQLQRGAEQLGLIAAHAADYYDRSGAYLVEQLIFPVYQGKGYAKLQQRLFQAQLLGAYECIWGTIHADNQASLRTAQACGRQLSEREIYLPLLI